MADTAGLHHVPDIDKWSYYNNSHNNVIYGASIMLEPPESVQRHKQLDKKLSEQFQKEQERRSKAAWLENPGKTFCVSLKNIILVINIVIILACTGTLLFQGSKCLSRYLASDTKAIMSVRPTGETTFLAFTICPTFEEAYVNSSLDSLQIMRRQYKDGFFYGNLSVNGDFEDDGFKLFNSVTYDLEDMMWGIVLSTADVQQPKISLPMDNSNKSIVEWDTKYVDTYGRCYEMRIAPNVTHLNIINIVFKSKIGIHVFMHHPGQRMDVDSKTKVYGHLQKMLFIDITHDLTVNTLEAEGAIPCNSSMDTIYDDCVYEKITDSLMADFGCVVPWLPRRKDVSICKFEGGKDDELREKVMNRYDYLSSNGQRSLCQVPCATMEVFLGLPFGGITDPDEAYIKLYIKSTIKVKKTVLDYTWISMLAEIGGYTGLLLGISVVNVASYLDRLFLRFYQN